MNWFFHFFEILTKLGWMVMIPLLIAITGVCMGVSLGKSLRAGLGVTACLLGITLLVNTLGNSLSATVAEIAARYDLALEITDVGWNATAVIASSTKVGMLIIPLFLLVNGIMLALRATRTLNLDLWNFWHAAFVGVLVQTLTDNFFFALVAATAVIILLLVLADRSAPALERYSDLPGVSVAHGFATVFVPVGALVNFLFDRLPWKPHFTLPSLQKRVGFLADPLFLGCALGALLGFLAGRDGYGISQITATMGLVVFLAPKIGQALTEAMAPVAAAAADFAQKRLKLNGRVYIGLSPIAALGNSTVLVVSLLMAPATLFLAGYLPGNRFLPQADVVMLLYMMAILVAVCRGDLLRSLVAGLLSVVAMLYSGSALAELFTRSAVAANAEAYGTLGVISNLCDGSNPLAWLAVKAGTFGIAGITLLAVIAVALAVWNRNCIMELHPSRHSRKKHRPAPLAGAVPSDAPLPQEEPSSAPPPSDPPV